MFHLAALISIFTIFGCTPPNSIRESSKLAGTDGAVGSAVKSETETDCVKSEKLLAADHARRECLRTSLQKKDQELEAFLSIDLPQRKEKIGKSCVREQQRVYDTCSGGSYYVKEFCDQARNALEKCRSRQNSENQLLVQIEKNVRERIDLAFRQANFACENQFTDAVAAANRCLR